MPIEPRRVEDGWVFQADDGKTVGPFSLEQMDDLEFDKTVASQLDCSPGDIFKATLQIPEKRRIAVESQNPAVRFTAEAGLGPDVPASGFILFEGDDDWIATESTYLYGTLIETKNEGTKNEEVSNSETLQPVIVYAQRDRRGITLARDAAFKLGTRALRPTGKTLGSSGPPTLMGLDPIRQFLAGENVDHVDLYKLGLSGLKRFSNLDWDTRLYDVLVCLILSTYFYDLFGAFPLTILKGAYRGGKTRLLLAFTYMSHRGMAILDPSEASIFRTGEAWKPTLAIDEFYDVTKEIERILRAAYKRGPRVPRVEKTKAGVFYLGLFDFYSKVVVASPDPVPANIVDKGIEINMRRMPDPNPEKRDPRPEDFEIFRSKGYIARLTWAQQIRAIAGSLDGEELELSGRDYEVWKPVLTVARLFGGEVWRNVHAYAKESTEEKHQSSDEELKEVLSTIYEMVKEENGNFPVQFTPKQLHDRIWTRLKDNFRITKEKQEVQGEVSEKYDYDTHAFERVYRVNKIGQTYLGQLGLKGKHGKSGTRYVINSPLEFHALVTRYHPLLPGLEDDYANLVLSSKLPSPLSPSSPEPNFPREMGGRKGDDPYYGDDPVVTKDSASFKGDDQVVTVLPVVTNHTPPNERENRLGDNRDDLDDLLGDVPVSSESTSTEPAFAITRDRADHNGGLFCPLCRITWPDQPSYDNHLDTYKHDETTGA